MIRIAALLIFMAALGVRSAAAQATPPPIQGVTGTIATEGSRDGVKKAAGAAARGVKKILPGAGPANAQDPLEALTEGSHVVVRDAAPPETSVEGVVIDVNKKRQQITVRVGDKTTQTLRVIESDNAGSEQGARVLVSLANQVGDTKVSYPFVRVP